MNGICFTCTLYAIVFAMVAAGMYAGSSQPGGFVFAVFSLVASLSASLYWKDSDETQGSNDNGRRVQDLQSVESDDNDVD